MSFLKEKENSIDNVQSLIEFYVNGELYSIKNEYPLSTTLNHYLRNVLRLTGTKVYCKEGGCGLCTVHVECFDPDSKEFSTMAVNSCLLPLYSCNNLRITTVEGLGSKSNGLNAIQKRLADNNGSQCGYCTPGYVMSMFSLLKTSPKPTKKQIEDALDGNICRCTGYRAILDSMKSFAVNEQPIDIEDLSTMTCLNKKQTDAHECSSLSRSSFIQFKDRFWYSPQTLDELFNLLNNKHKNQLIRFVSGNTSAGYYKEEASQHPAEVIINLRDVRELVKIEKSNDHLKIGSSLTITSLANMCEKSSANEGFHHLSELALNLRKIGNTQVRNMASWSGNLVMKKQHADFLSDLVVFLETVSAQLEVSQDGSIHQMSVSEFLSSSNQLSSNFLIIAMILPKLDDNLNRVKMFKVAPRVQNSLSYVSCGFRFHFKSQNSRELNSRPVIVFNGAHESFFHATKTESFLEHNKNLENNDVLRESFQVFKNELKSSGLLEANNPLLPSANYRLNLCLGLYYKFILGTHMELDEELKSAVESITDTRPVSQGTQSYETREELFPLTKPMPKLNAYTQATGESKYVDDLSELNHQLHAVFMVTQVGNARIQNIDIEQVLRMPGVRRVILAKDIPGENNIMPKPFGAEPLFTDHLVEYAGQPVGIVIADTYQQAKEASKKIQINYSQINKPILTIKQAMEKNSFHKSPMKDFVKGDADEAIKLAKNKISGEIDFNSSQFAFFMEGIYANCEPTEDGYKIECTTQWIDSVQRSVAMVLGIDNSSIIDVQVKQLGGAFGSKITRGNFAATASALGAHYLRRPVKVTMDLNDCLDIIGKRPTWHLKYEVGFEDDGKLSGIKFDWYSDPGFSPNGSFLFLCSSYFDTAYKCNNYLIRGHLVKTNTPASTELRSPDFLVSVHLTEQVMDHVANHLNKDPLEVRRVNFFKAGDSTASGHELPYIDIDNIVNQIAQSSEYYQRKEAVDEFNKRNIFKKKGISLIPLRYSLFYNLGYYNALLSVRHHDGSVAVSHGGVEMGQGIHTKVAQVVAHELAIPIEKVSVKSTNNLVNPNGLWTGGSVTSELCSKSVLECCKLLNQTLEPVRKQMPTNYTWEELIAKAFSLNLNLSTMYLQRPEENFKDLFNYDIDAAACSEVLIDVLTGETQILRTDILYDCGQTMNGLIDICQAEGGFVMGLGAFLLEKTIYDPETGKCLNNGTWFYKPPQPKDIPIDLRISFVKNKPNPLGFFGSKAIGEPPLHLSNTIVFALKHAISSARKDRGVEGYFKLEVPATIEKVQEACLLDSNSFVFKS